MHEIVEYLLGLVVSSDTSTSALDQLAKEFTDAGRDRLKVGLLLSTVFACLYWRDFISH